MKGDNAILSVSVFKVNGGLMWMFLEISKRVALWISFPYINLVFPYRGDEVHLLLNPFTWGKHGWLYSTSFYCRFWSFKAMDKMWEDFAGTHKKVDE